jgi:class 3 adenylate cyclase/tetratricopeptide (TPR) repeat protein
MTCPRCQAENRDGARFCRECGATFGSACSSCGAKTDAGSKFCDNCGAPLVVSPTPSTASPRFAAPDTYTPKYLAEKILTSKATLEGERKQVTVLFADLKGSMELLADRDPEEARTLLDPVLERMMEAVHRYEGTVNQVMGDGIMALFGAPVAHEDHAVRACYTALRMQETVKRYAEEVQRSQGLPLHVRIGLNSGEVVVRAIGNDLRMDYSAVGQTTHLAARMEQTALPGSILLTGATLWLAEGYVEVRPLGPVHVRGLDEPVEAFEVTGAGPVRTRLQAAATRGLTRFVGRDAELEHLRQALERARAGHGQVAALVGEPGVGKSRLVWEVTHSHRTAGWLVLQAGSVSYGKATPYLPVIDLLKGYCQIEDRDDHRLVREKVIGKLLNLDDALKPTLPAFLALLDVPGEDSQWDGLDPSQRRQRTLDAVKRLVLRESQVQPLLVIFEDLHWIDTETQALLDTLVDSLPTARLLLLVNYRPEYQHGWGSKTYYTQLRLDPLPPENAQAFLETLLGQDSTLDDLKRRLIERTEGNPFFLEESVRTLVETRALLGERGHYRLATALPSIEVPATVQAILAARIDRLPPEAKSLLETAAVVGTDVPITLLQALVERPEPALRQALASLPAAEFLYETRLFPEVEYTFKHALTQEVAYGSLLHERRRALHARLVGVIERLSADRLGVQVERLAHHAVRGEVWEKAVSYLRRAGAKAHDRSANRAAAAAFEQALAASGHLPETPQRLEQEIDLHLDARIALHPVGQPDAQFGHLRDAERLATRLGDRHRLGWVSLHLSRFQTITGTPREVARFAGRARAIADELEDPGLRTAADHQAGFAHHSSGDYRQAARVFQTVVEDLDAQGRRHDRCALPGFPAVMDRGYLAAALAELGEFDEALEHGHEALRLAESMDHHPFSLCIACTGLASLLCVWGDAQSARPVAERHVATAQAWDLGLTLPVGLLLLGRVHVLSGQIPEAVRLLEQAVAGSNAVLPGYRAVEARVRLGEAYQLAHRSEEAGAIGVEALALARDRGLRGIEAYVLRLLGEVAAHDNPSEIGAAEARYHEALTLATELGMRPLTAHCHLGLGQLFHRTDKPADAHEHLTTATTMYREMGMVFWLEKAEAAWGALR